jgi:hypothetical protein
LQWIRPDRSQRNTNIELYPVNAYPSFLNVFGIKAPDGSLNIPPSWQNGIGAATNCGEVIGLQVSSSGQREILVTQEIQIAGIMSERVGYRWTLILALTTLIGFIFIPFYGRFRSNPSINVQLLTSSSENPDCVSGGRASAGDELGRLSGEVMFKKLFDSS